jgi:hypothetical protein
MRVRLFEGSVADSAAASMHQVQEGQSIVFLTPSVLNPVLCARFHDAAGAVHQVPVERILSIDPDAPDVRLPVRYLDPETGQEIAPLRADVDALKAMNGRLGPRAETVEEQAARSKKLADVLADAVSRDAPPIGLSKQCTTDGRSPAEARASQTNETGQHPSYIVLCAEERARGFVRPYRDAYKHVGRAEPVNDDIGVKPHTVRRVGGCGTVTRMGRALSETYARDPSFYGATFCVSCNRHLPVAEFVWTADGQQVGT